MHIFRFLTLSLIAATIPATAQQLTLPLWSHGAPEPATAKGAERNITAPSDPLIAGPGAP